MIRTFQSMRRVNPGFSKPEALQTLRISIPRNAAPKDPELLLMQQNLVSAWQHPGRVGGEPYWRAAHDWIKVQDPIFASDHSYAANQIPPLRRFITAAPGTFQALGGPCLPAANSLGPIFTKGATLY